MARSRISGAPCVSASCRFQSNPDVGYELWHDFQFVLAEAEIPKAISDAFRSGNLGVMDYSNLRNVQADTSMRASIAGEDAGEERAPPE